MNMSAASAQSATQATGPAITIDSTKHHIRSIQAFRAIAFLSIELQKKALLQRLTPYYDSIMMAKQVCRTADYRVNDQDRGTVWESKEQPAFSPVVLVDMIVRAKQGQSTTRAGHYGQDRINEFCYKLVEAFHQQQPYRHLVPKLMDDLFLHEFKHVYDAYILEGATIDDFNKVLQLINILPSNPRYADLVGSVFGPQDAPYDAIGENLFGNAGQRVRLDQFFQTICGVMNGTPYESLGIELHSMLEVLQTRSKDEVVGRVTTFADYKAALLDQLFV